MSTSKSSLILNARPSSTRGHSDHGWLNTYHTFAFGGWSSSKYQSLSDLRVINEDRVTGGNGFGRHGHSDFEIFSYILSGALRHDDSLGNLEVLKRGDVQFTSAGTGIQHAENNADADAPVHFMQMWIKPATRGLKPKYQTKHFSDADKTNVLKKIITPDGADNTITINQSASVYASLLADGHAVRHILAPDRIAYIHLTMDATGYNTENKQTSITVTSGDASVVLAAGDGVEIRHANGDNAPAEILITGHSKTNKQAELILFDLRRTP